MVFLKLGIGIALITYLIRTVGWEELFQSIRDMNADLLTMVSLFAILQVPLSCWKWSRSLYQHNLIFPPLYLLKVCSGGLFLNNFLPTGVGGDAYRIFKTLPSDGKPLRAVSAAVFDRAIGLLALLCIAYVCAALVYSSHQYAIIDQFFLPATVMLLAALTSLFVLPKMGGLRRVLETSRPLAPLANNLRLLIKKPANLALIVWLAFVYQLLAIGMIYWLFAATGQALDFAVCAIITAVGGVLIMLPLSIAGLGIYEGALVGSAVLFGAEAQVAIAVSLCWRLVTSGVSLSCGLVFLLPDQSTANSTSAP